MTPEEMRYFLQQQQQQPQQQYQQPRYQQQQQPEVPLTEEEKRFRQMALHTGLGASAGGLTGFSIKNMMDRTKAYNEYVDLIDNVTKRYQSKHINPLEKKHKGFFSRLFSSEKTRQQNLADLADRKRKLKKLHEKWTSSNIASKNVDKLVSRKSLLRRMALPVLLGSGIGGLASYFATKDKPESFHTDFNNKVGNMVREGIQSGEAFQPFY